MLELGGEGLSQDPSNQAPQHVPDNEGSDSAGRLAHGHDPPNSRELWRGNPLSSRTQAQSVLLVIQKDAQVLIRSARRPSRRYTPSAAQACDEGSEGKRAGFRGLELKHFASDRTVLIE